MLPDTVGGSADLTGSNNTKTASLKRHDRGRSGRPLRLLRHPRARDGRGHERHRRCTAASSLRRHLPGVHRLLPPVDPPGGADGHARHLRHDPRSRSAWARTARRTSRSSIWRRCAPFPNLQVLRPADAIETAGVLADRARVQEDAERHRAHAPEPADGARRRRRQPLRPRRLHLLAGDASDPVRLIASGSEVQLALARARSAGEGRHRGGGRVDAVVGAVRRARTTAYRSEVMGGDGTVRVACEAASGFGWERWLGHQGRVRRHEGLRRLGQGRRPLQAFRHHGRGDRRSGAPAGSNNGGRHGGSGCNQRLRAHRPQRAARHRRDQAARTSRSWRSTISARSRPTPTCCASTPVHGRFPGEVKVDGDTIDVGRGKIKVTAETRSRPSCRTRRWASTSRWNAPASSPRRQTASAHLDRRRQARAGLGAGRRRRPHGRLRRQPRQARPRITSSSRTPRARPTASRRSPRCCNDAVGIEHGFMTTIHSYTGDQPTLDTMHKDLYRARAAALNDDPDLDRRRQGGRPGAARSSNGKLDGVAIRVPTPNVSVIDFKFVAKRATTEDEINERDQARRRIEPAARASSAWTNEPNGLDRLQPRSALVDLPHGPDQGHGRHASCA